MIDLSAAIDRIAAILAAVEVADGVPYFGTERVIAGERLGMPAALPSGAGWASFWYRGDGTPPEGRGTLADRFHWENFRVEVKWAPRDASTLLAWEKEITSLKQALLTAFAGDSKLNAGGSTAVCDDLDYSDVECGYVNGGGQDNTALYRVLRFDLRLKGLNEEGFAA